VVISTGATEGSAPIVISTGATGGSAVERSLDSLRSLERTEADEE
jgi:hypothetical protein